MASDHLLCKIYICAYEQYLVYYDLNIRQEYTTEDFWKFVLYYIFWYETNSFAAQCGKILFLKVKKLFGVCQPGKTEYCCQQKYIIDTIQYFRTIWMFTKISIFPCVCPNLLETELDTCHNCVFWTYLCLYNKKEIFNILCKIPARKMRQLNTYFIE